MHWAGLRPVYVMRRRVIISPTPSLSSQCTQCSPPIFPFPSHWLQFSLLSLSLRKKSNNRFSFFFLSLPLVLALGGHHGQLQLTWSDRRTVVSVVLISLAIITSPSSFLRSHALVSLHAPLLSNDGHSIPPDPPLEGREDSKRAQRRLNLGLITRLQRSTAIQRSSDHRPDAYSINGGTVVECTLIGGEIANRSKMRVGWFEG